MRTNPVKAKLRAGESVVGTWLAVPSPISARFMAQLGFDYLCVDMEHQPIDLETAAAMFATIAQSGVTALARIPWNTPENVKRVLDCGAHGIVVPMVNTRAEAEAAVAAAKYPPAGIRSVGGMNHCLNFDTDPATYYSRANDEVLVIVQAESPEGVENADAILSVPGVDGVFIGPNDLLSMMHMPPAMESPAPVFVEALTHIVKTADKYGVAPGIHTASAEACRRRMQEGFRFMAIASDARFMVAGAQAQLGEFVQSGGKEVLRY